MAQNKFDAQTTYVEAFEWQTTEFQQTEMIQLKSDEEAFEQQNFDAQTDKDNYFVHHL